MTHRSTLFLLILGLLLALPNAGAAQGEDPPRLRGVVRKPPAERGETAAEADAGEELREVEEARGEPPPPTPAPAPEPPAPEPEEDEWGAPDPEGEKEPRWKTIARKPPGERGKQAGSAATTEAAPGEAIPDPDEVPAADAGTGDLPEIPESPAVTGWLQVVRETPGDASAWVELGNAYSRRGRNDAAEASFRTATDLDPELSQAWNNLGSVYLQTFRDEEALEAFERAVAVDKSNAVAYYNRGIALERADRLEEALDSYEHALVLDPSLRLPSENPNIVNNRHLRVLLLRLYMRGGGATVLSLQSGESR